MSPTRNPDPHVNGFLTPPRNQRCVVGSALGPPDRLIGDHNSETLYQRLGSHD
jgi:hypothetical protein